MIISRHSMGLLSYTIKLIAYMSEICDILKYC